MHPPGDGGLGDAEDLGGLGMGQLLAGDEHGGIAEGRLEASDGALDPDRVVEVAAVGPFGQADEDGELLAERAEAAAAAA